MSYFYILFLTSSQTVETKIETSKFTLNSS